MIVNRLIIVFVFLIFILPQKIFSQDFEMGIIGGVDFTQVDGDLSAGYEKFGGQGGFVLTNSFKNNVSFEMQMKYIQKGSRNVHTNQSGYVYYVIRLQYVEVPVIFTYPLSKFSKKPYLQKFSLAGGLTLGYLIKAMEDKDGYGFLPAYPSFNKYELGYVVGFKYKLNKKLYANALFGYSILRVRKKACGITPWYYFTTCGQYNNSVQLSLTYKFVK